MEIDIQFKELIPALSEEEYKQLEANIIKEGCRDSLIAWDGILIDGHNRYEICTNHGLDYKTIKKDFDNREQAINWIIDNQLGRRNITLTQRDYLLGLRYKSEKKQGARTDLTLGQNVPKLTTAEIIGKQHGVSEKTVKRAEKFATGLDNIAKVLPDVKQEVLKGESNFTKQEISSFSDAEEKEIGEKFEEVKKAKAHVSNNSGNDEWYTPPDFTDIAREIMGNIDLDVASCEIANQFVKADKYYTQEDDSLTMDWFGNIWMNPPYSQPLIMEFIEKLISEIDKGNVDKACVLVNNATETKWMQLLLKNCDYVWFPLSRIKFINYKGVPEKTPLQGQAFLIFNSEPKRDLRGVLLKNEK